MAALQSQEGQADQICGSTKSSICRTLSLFDLSHSLWKSPFKVVVLSDLTQNTCWRKSLSLGHVSKNISGDYLTSQINKRLTRNLKGRLGKCDVHRGFWKTLAYSWGPRRLYSCTKLYTCPGKTWEVPYLSPLADLESLWKQKIKSKTELYTDCLSIEIVPENTHTAWQQRLEGLVFQDV